MRVEARVSERPCRYCGQRTPRDACGDCMCELAERARLRHLETRARPVVLALSIEDRLALDELAREWGYLWAMRLWLALAVGPGAWHDPRPRVYRLDGHDVAFVEEGARGDIRRGRRDPGAVWPEVYHRLTGLLPAWVA